jgi:large subunit ribosomal protein L13Ae
MPGVPTRSFTERRVRKGLKKHTPDTVIVDLKDHMIGRAAAVIAKQLLLGKKVTVVRTDEANIAGAEIRNKIKYLNFLRKKHTTNPKKGPFHRRSPSEVFTRVVRGMLPYYTKRGKLALRRLRAFEGVPVNVARNGGRVVIPKAERKTRLAKERKFTVLGNMCQHVGWKYKSVVDKLEAARKERSARHFAKRAAIRAKWDSARKEATKKISKGNLAILKKFGKA